MPIRLRHSPSSLVGRFVSKRRPKRYFYSANPDIYVGYIANRVPARPSMVGLAKNKLLAFNDVTRFVSELNGTDLDGKLGII